MKTSESIKELATALSKAQAVMVGASKDKANPFFKSKYADLSSVWDACRVPLTQNGLSIVQTTSNQDSENTFLETTLMHLSGEYITSSYPVLCKARDPQGLGSGMTYARRYALMAMVGIAPDDDDGEASMARGNGKAQEIAHKISLPKVMINEAPRKPEPSLDELAEALATAQEPSLAAYLRKAGKHKGKSLSTISKKDNENFLKWFDEVNAKGEDLHQSVREDAAHVREYLSESAP